MRLLLIATLALLLILGVAMAAMLTAESPEPVRKDEEEILEPLLAPWTGDLEGMARRGFVRVLTVHNPLFLTFDGMDQKGLAHDMARAFEDHLAEQMGRVRSPQVVLIPVARDELLSGLEAGRGDIAAGNLTITAGREQEVVFSSPLQTGVDELVATGPGAPEIASLDDLVTVGLSLRTSSSYHEHLQALNDERREAGKQPIPVEAMDEYLEDHDLLDMVGAGILPAVVVDSHKLSFWRQVMPKIVVHEDLAIHRGGAIGWAVRRGSPQLLAAVNSFAAKVRKGTLLGNMLRNRYLGDTEWVENALVGENRSRYENTVEVIKKYAARYDFDWLMIAAQAFQESRFDQGKRSSAGAVGVMQLLPTTAADPNVGIPDITTLENNIHAGVKYLRFLRERYFSEEGIAPVDRVLFSFAAYNAGPGNMARARRRAAQLGRDPDKWFGNVEIGMYRAVSGEPAAYVRNIYKYYVTYKRLEAARQKRREALEKAG